jgi:hypothetical protein
MVWLFSVLAVSNIAMGYGLAVYFHQHFGTAVPSCGPLRKKKAVAPSAPAMASEMPTVTPAVVEEMIEAEVAEIEKSEPIEIGAPVAPAEEIGGLPPVDEENVLAGIEEFRSQLAKMNATADDDASENEVEKLEEELVGAAN